MLRGDHLGVEAGDRGLVEWDGDGGKEEGGCCEEDRGEKHFQKRVLLLVMECSFADQDNIYPVDKRE